MQSLKIFNVDLQAAVPEMRKTRPVTRGVKEKFFSHPWQNVLDIV